MRENEKDYSNTSLKRNTFALIERDRRAGQSHSMRQEIIEKVRYDMLANRWSTGPTTNSWRCVLGLFRFTCHTTAFPKMCLWSQKPLGLIKKAAKPHVETQANRAICFLLFLAVADVPGPCRLSFWACCVLNNHGIFV